MTTVVCFVRNYDGKLKLFGSLDFSLRRHSCVYKEAWLTSSCNCFALLATYICTHVHRWIQWTSLTVTLSNHSMFHSCNILTPKVRNRVWANSGCDLRQSPAKSGTPTGRALGGLYFGRCDAGKMKQKQVQDLGLVVQLCNSCFFYWYYFLFAWFSFLSQAVQELSPGRVAIGAAYLMHPNCTAPAKFD